MIYEIDEHDLIKKVYVLTLNTSIRTAARKIGVSPTFIQQIITGQSKPSDKIAEYFGYEKKVVYRQLTKEN